MRDVMISGECVDVCCPTEFDCRASVCAVLRALRVRSFSVACLVGSSCFGFVPGAVMFTFLFEGGTPTHVHFGTCQAKDRLPIISNVPTRIIRHGDELIDKTNRQP